MKKFSLTFTVFIFFIGSLFSQEKKAPKAKTGWSFGGVPVVAYDSDIGFKYGGLVNLYDYGDGATYPMYKHSIYMEWSRTTKGSGINQITYDSGDLFSKIRLNGEVSLLTEKALDFYGFNGYEANYNPGFTDDTDTANYISRMYYRLDRKLTRVKGEVLGSIIGKKLQWLGGVAYYGNKIGNVDINKLNEGKDSVDMLPDVDLLYKKYVDWGVIPFDQKDGGNTLLVKLGLVWDTRDNEPNPQTGLWEELMLINGNSFLGNGNLNFTKLILTHRQYFTLVEKKLSLAYRLSYQGKIAGTMPFYMLPFVYDSKLTRDGMGGAKTMRGILRDRIVGESMTFGTVELRWIFLRTLIGNQNFYIALSGFSDGGMVLKNYEYNTDNIPVGVNVVQDNEKLHLSYGGGIRFALNDNFIVAVDYGMAADKRDGSSGLYIGLNWLF
ncbi:MAG: BamA/TamA family outer membrane protein [Chlorobi bacterium]|nr:BamA/TamA family outer membrane protein [Chlorobiota bacterium]